MKNSAWMLALLTAPLWAQTLNQGERDYAMSQLHATRKVFLDAIHGLSQAQWNFKPAADRWSIAEIAEHLVISEDNLFGEVQQMLKSPALPAAGRKTGPAQDPLVYRRMTDRSRKVKADPRASPRGASPRPQRRSKPSSSGATTPSSTSRRPPTTCAAMSAPAPTPSTLTS